MTSAHHLALAQQATDLRAQLAAANQHVNTIRAALNNVEQQLGEQE